MCKFIKEELDYSEAENEQGWKEKNRIICTLKMEAGKKRGVEEDVCCRFAETNSFTKCGNYRAQ